MPRPRLWDAGARVGHHPGGFAALEAVRQLGQAEVPHRRRNVEHGRGDPLDGVIESVAPEPRGGLLRAPCRQGRAGRDQPDPALRGTRGLRRARVIPNPIALEQSAPSRRRSTTTCSRSAAWPTARAHRAIDVAKRTGRRLVIAGPVQPGQETYFAEAIEPHLAPWAPGLRRRSQRPTEAAASRPGRRAADADPLGRAVRHGHDRGARRRSHLPKAPPPRSSPNGENGFLVADKSAMAAAVEKLPTIDLAWTANGRLGAAVTRPIWSTASTRRARFQKPEPFERWTASEARRSCGPETPPSVSGPRTARATRACSERAGTWLDPSRQQRGARLALCGLGGLTRTGYRRARSRAVQMPPPGLRRTSEAGTMPRR